MLDKQILLTEGGLIQSRMVEAFVMLNGCILTWTWVSVINSFSSILTPHSIGNFINLNFILTSSLADSLSFITTLFLVGGFFKLTKYSYMLGAVCFYLMYIVRYSQSDISYAPYFLFLAFCTLAYTRFLEKPPAEHAYYFLNFQWLYFGVALTWIGSTYLLGGSDIGTSGIEGRALYFVNLVNCFAWLLWFKLSRTTITILMGCSYFWIVLVSDIALPNYMYHLALIGFPWWLAFDWMKQKRA